MLSRQAEATFAFVGQSESAGSRHSAVYLARDQFDASMLRAGLPYFH